MKKIFKYLLLASTVIQAKGTNLNQKSQNIDYLKDASINILDKDYTLTYLGKGQQTLVFDINYNGEEQVLKIPFTKSGPPINQLRIDEAISKGLLVPETSIDFDESTIKNLEEYRADVNFNEVKISPKCELPKRQGSKELSVYENKKYPFSKWENMSLEEKRQDNKVAIDYLKLQLEMFKHKLYTHDGHRGNIGYYKGKLIFIDNGGFTSVDDDDFKNTFLSKNFDDSKNIKELLDFINFIGDDDLVDVLLDIVFSSKTEDKIKLLHLTQAISGKIFREFLLQDLQIHHVRNMKTNRLIKIKDENGYADDKLNPILNETIHQLKDILKQFRDAKPYDVKTHSIKNVNINSNEIVTDPNLETYMNFIDENIILDN